MHEISASIKSLTSDESAVLRCAIYFSLFSYPLKAQELFENSRVQCDLPDFKMTLNNLCNNGLLRNYGEFYLCADADEKTIKRRLSGNAGAAAIMGKAYHYSNKIAAFPFVRGVFLSGALSKNYYDDKGDIDFFIVTEPGRLWVCRTLLILRYKMLPANKKKFWCVNYFISSDNLEIPDRNLFTATEIAHLIPANNYDLYSEFLQKNSWYRNFFPNKTVADAENCQLTESGSTKKLKESIFSGWGGVFDDLLLRITLKHWRKKFPDMSADDFNLQYRSRKNVCKRHNTGFQNKVLSQWEEKTKAYEREYNIRLT